MNFLVDAQLPRRLASWLREAGHDAIHTRDLPTGNRTTDARINELAAVEGRVVITKDADFVDSFLIRREPARLLLISSGNITNVELEQLLLPHLAEIIVAFQSHAFVELSAKALVIHE